MWKGCLDLTEKFLVALFGIGAGRGAHPTGKPIHLSKPCIEIKYFRMKMKGQVLTRLVNIWRETMLLNGMKLSDVKNNRLIGEERRKKR